MKCVFSIVFSIPTSCSLTSRTIDFPNRAERFRTSLQFINLAYRDLYATLDACKAADYVVFILSPTVEVTPWGDMLLRTLQAQGLPDVVSVIAPGYPIDTKTRPGILKSLLSFMQYFAPEQSRVFDLEVGSDRLSALRVLSEGKPGDVRWREGRAWLLGEKVEWEEASGESSGNGTLKVTGVVRGAQLSPNRLVHLPNFGDFQISRVSVFTPLSWHAIGKVNSNSILPESCL